MDITLFDFYLPEELIAQSPMADRDQCRLMVIDRKNQTIQHRRFYDILDYLKPGDVLVRNNTKVIPARLLGVKEETKGKAEVLLLHEVPEEGEDVWECLVGAAKSVKVGSRCNFGEGKLIAEIDFDAIAKAEEAKTKWKSKHASVNSLYAD